MRKHAAVLVCAVTVITLSASLSFAQIDPLSLPLLVADSFTYLGAFRVPQEGNNGQTFDYGGGPLAFNPHRGSLFVGNTTHRVAELTIPEVVNSPDPQSLPFSTYLQPFADPSEGRYGDIGPDLVVRGLMVYGNRLHGTATIYYDARNTQRVSHFARSLQLDQPSFSGWSQVWETAQSGFVSGAMSPVPAEWQARLGGPALTGQCCIPIMWRTSNGPSAFAFDPAAIGAAVVSAAPLLYYPAGLETLGAWDGSNPTFGATTTMGGMAVIAGTRTAIYIGSNGLGEHCYGVGTENATLHNTYGPDGGLLCYDPVFADKGSHAYPYRYQMWAYDLNDLAAVRAGTKQPWQVVPYGVWPLHLPTPERTFRIGGVAYDPQRQIIYVSQLFADTNTFARRPVIHALRVSGAATATMPANSTVKGVTIAADRVAPQPPGSPISFVAVPTGGTAPLQYRWSIFDGSDWRVVADWSTASRFTWTPAGANVHIRAIVAVRSSANTQVEASASMPFPISTGTTSSKVSAVTLTSDVSSPQPPGIGVTWTAVPTGGYAPQQYKWFVYDGANWNLVADWSTENTLRWNTPAAAGSYLVSVWVRSPGNPVDYFEASVERPFVVDGSAPPPSARVRSVTIASNYQSPQRIGTAITFTATPSGGVAPLQYRWVVLNHGTWTALSNWATNNSFTWTPLVANANNRIGVWVRSAGNSADSPEAAADTLYAIETAAASPPAPPPSPPAPPASTVAAVTLTPDVPSPQPAGRTITWSAAPVGGVGPHQFKWFTYNGSAWIVSANWSTSSTFAWTPAVASTGYRVAVWVRSAGNSVDYFEASTERYYAIGPAATTPVPAPTPPGTPQTRVTAVALTTDRPTPQAAGTTIVLSASPTGGVSPHDYKWYVYDGSAWTVARNWSTASTFAWMPTVARPHYRVAVWVRSAGNSVDHYEASTETGYVIGPPSAPAPAPIPSATPGVRVTDVRLSTNLPAPQMAGTTVALSAVPTGGVAPHQYKWFVFDGSQWSTLINWTTGHTVPWTPAAGNPAYRVAVWVRSAGATQDSYEAASELAYPIVPAGTTAGRVTSVTLRADRTAPQAVGTTITWTAAAAGGGAPRQYKWFVYDGATWHIAMHWSTEATFAWRANVPNRNYRVAVWVRSAGSTTDYFEASTESAFPIQ